MKSAFLFIILTLFPFILLSRCNTVPQKENTKRVEIETSSPPVETIEPMVLSTSGPEEPMVLKEKEGLATKFYLLKAGRGPVIEKFINDHVKNKSNPEAKVEVHQNFIGPDPNSKGDVADLLIYTDEEGYIQRCDDFLDMLLGGIPQIEIEAKIVEIKEDSDFQLGVTTNLTEADPGFDDGNDPKTLFQKSLSSHNTAEFFESTSLNRNFQGSLVSLGTIHDELQVDIFIEALKSTGRAEVLSEPKITVLNGYYAEVFVGSDVPIQQVKIAGTVSLVQTTFQKVGINLRVTPFIIGNDTVRLELFPEVASVIGYTPGGAFNPPNPIIRTRNAKTTVNIKDGATYIIGGLLSTQDISTEVKTPFLGDIPLLGYLFRYNRTTKESSKLIFFITPRILMPTMKAKEKLIIPPDMR